MILVHLALQSDESARYADLRIVCGLKDPPSLTQALAPLIAAGLVASEECGTDGREKMARLRDQGFDEIGKILHPERPDHK